MKIWKSLFAPVFPFESLLPLVPPFPIWQQGLSWETLCHPKMWTGNTQAEWKKSLLHPFSPSLFVFLTHTHLHTASIIYNQILSIFYAVIMLLFEEMIQLFLDIQCNDTHVFTQSWTLPLLAIARIDVYNHVFEKCVKLFSLPVPLKPEGSVCSVAALLSLLTLPSVLLCGVSKRTFSCRIYSDDLLGLLCFISPSWNISV